MYINYQNHRTVSQWHKRSTIPVLPALDINNNADVEWNIWSFKEISESNRLLFYSSFCFTPFTTVLACFALFKNLAAQTASQPGQYRSGNARWMPGIIKNTHNRRSCVCLTCVNASHLIWSRAQLFSALQMRCCCCCCCSASQSANAPTPTTSYFASSDDAHNSS